MNILSRPGIDFHKLGIATATATTIASIAGWMVLLLLAGDFIPRPTLIAAIFAIAVAAGACRAARNAEAGILLVAGSLAALAPPSIGDAPDMFRFVGFLSLGYPIAALFIKQSSAPGRVR